MLGHLYNAQSAWQPLFKTTKGAGFSMTVNYTQNFKIDWGDGTAEAFLAGNRVITHDYLQTGEKLVSMTIYPRSQLHLDVIDEAITGTMNLSAVATFGNGNLYLHSNPNLTELILPNAPYINILHMSSCGLTSLDLKGGSINALYVHLNPNIASINFAGAEIRGRIFAYNAKLNQHFPLGSQIKVTIDCLLQGNGMSAANVNSSITSLYNNRTYDLSNNKTLNIGGNNAAASGVRQAPAGYVQGGADGTPATVKEMVYVLENQTNADGTKKYKWTITVN